MVREGRHQQPGAGLVRALNALGTWRSMAALALVVLGLYALVLGISFGLVPVGPGMTNRLGKTAGGDFAFFYAAGTLASQGQAHLAYQADNLTPVAQTALGWNGPPLDWAYPPPLLLPLLILAQLPPGVALACWSLGLAGCSMLAGGLGAGGWRQPPLALAFPGLGFALFTGQFSPMVGLLLGLTLPAYAPSVAGRGMALGLLVFKPHFAPVPALVALARRDYAMLGIAFVWGGGLALASLWLFGTDTWAAFFAAGRHHWDLLVTGAAPLGRSASIFGALRTYGVGIQSAMALHLLGAAAAVVVCHALARRATRESVRTLSVIGAALVITPYAFDYDLIYLLIPWAVLIREAREGWPVTNAHFALWVALTVVLPGVWLVSLTVPISIGAPALLGVLLLGLWASESDGRLGPARPSGINAG